MYQQLSVNYVDGCSCVCCFRFHHHRNYWLVMHFFKRYVALAEFTHKVIITCEKFIIIFVYIFFFKNRILSGPSQINWIMLKVFNTNEYAVNVRKMFFAADFCFAFFLFEYIDMWRWVEKKAFLEQWQQIKPLLHLFDDICVYSKYDARLYLLLRWSSLYRFDLGNKMHRIIFAILEFLQFIEWLMQFGSQHSKSKKTCQIHELNEISKRTH